MIVPLTDKCTCKGLNSAGPSWTSRYYETSTQLEPTGLHTGAIMCGGHTTALSHFLTIQPSSHQACSSSWTPLCHFLYLYPSLHQGCSSSRTALSHFLTIHPFLHQWCSSSRTALSHFLYLYPSLHQG